jgi:hypothetical protein
MRVTDYQLLYETTLAAKQELDAQHELLGKEVKRLKAQLALCSLRDRGVLDAEKVVRRPEEQNIGRGEVQG